MWAGIAGNIVNNNTQYEIAISVHDSVYSTDFASATIPYYPGQPDKNAQAIQLHVSDTLRKFSTEHLCKFLGAGVTLSLLKEVDSLTVYPL
jgi:alpha,alpha-trehalose phosphorylase (configuration-retaining)